MTLMSIMDAVVPIAREAGTAILRIYDSPVEATTKADGSPVTKADADAEAIILAGLAALTPEIPIVSEENIASHGPRRSQRFWLVDPLDGTKEFIKRDGKGSFTVNIALVERGVPVLGVVYAPALDRMFTGIAGAGAKEICNGETRLSVVRPVPSSGPVAVASASHRDEETNTWLTKHEIDEIVSIGSSLKFCLVAAGEADVYPRFGPTMEWDTAAGDAVLRAAGGQVTDPQGAPFVYGKPAYRNGAFIAWGKMT